MTGYGMLGLARATRSAVDECLARVSSFKGMLRAPLWASLFPPATWYVIGSSLNLETQLYLGREEAERRLTTAAVDLAEAERQAAALGDADGNPADLLRIIGAVNELVPLVAELEQAITQRQAASDQTLARATDLPAAPLKILAGAGVVAKYGAWVVAAVVAVVLVYAWKAGSLKAGMQRAASKAAGAVT